LKKSLAFVFVLILLCTFYLGAIDLTGSYVAHMEDGTFAVQVADNGGEYTFYFLTLEEEMALDLSESLSANSYRQFTDHGDEITFYFDGDVCFVESGGDELIYGKALGPANTIDGVYRMVIEDQADELIDLHVRHGADFPVAVFKFWIVDFVENIEKNSDDMYTIEMDYEFEFDLVFDEESCEVSFAGSDPVSFSKETSEYSRYFGDSVEVQAPPETAGGDYSTFPEYAFYGDSEYIYESIYSDPLPRSHSAPLRRIRTEKPRVFNPKRGKTHSLSPNGRILLVTDRSYLEFYDAESRDFDFLFEVDIKDTIVDPGSITWAPDSAKIAFTGDFFKFMNETDLMMVDIASRSLRNLTDDGANKLRLPRDQNSAPIDLTPLWLPDSHGIIFQRIPPGKEMQPEIHLISIDESEPRLLLNTLFDYPGIVQLKYDLYYGQLFINYSDSKRNSPQNGLYVYSSYDSYLRQTYSHTDPDRSQFVIADIALEGNIALIFYPQFFTGLSSPDGKPRGEILNISYEETEPLSSNGTNLVNAALSPADSKIIYIEKDNESGTSNLFIRNTESADRSVLLYSTDDAFFGFSPGSGMTGHLGLYWGNNDLVMVTAMNKAYIFTLNSNVKNIN
jgi:hypothetical protein